MVRIEEIETEILPEPTAPGPLPGEPASRETLRDLVRELLREELERATRLGDRR